MAKYRLVKGAGAHTGHKHGTRLYRAGEIIEEDADLVALFPGKFELVEGAPPQDTGKDPDHFEETTFDRTPSPEAPVLPSEEVGSEEVAGDEESDETNDDSEPVEEIEDQSGTAPKPARASGSKKTGTASRSRKAK